MCRCSSGTPLNTRRRSSVGLRSRPSSSALCLSDGPVGNHPAAAYRTAHEECTTAGPVIRAARTVHRRGAPELGDDERGAPGPERSEIGAEGCHCAVQAREPLRQQALHAALVGVRVPSRGLEHGHPRPCFVSHRPGYHARGRVDPLCRRPLQCRARGGLLARLIGDRLRAQRFAQSLREPVVLRIQVREPRQQLLVRTGRGLRRLGHDRRRAPQDQRHVRADRDRALRTARERRQGAIEPAVAGAGRVRQAVLEHVLAVEM